MKFYIIRHLKTEWNFQGKLQGSKDISIAKITPEVFKVISINLEELNKHNFDCIVTSELIRTQETAYKYNFTNFVIDKNINELNFGKYEGVLKEEMLEIEGEKWINRPSSIDFGESFTDFEKRLKTFLVKYSSYDKVLVFAHGAVVRALLAIVKRKNLDEMNKFHVDNNSITTIEYESINCP